MDSVTEIASGTQARVFLTGTSRISGGAFQVWRDDALVFQGSSYGMPPTSPAPDQWRPIGLVTRGEAGYSIVFYVPSNAESGDYELRLATTIGSRSAVIRVVSALR